MLKKVSLTALLISQAAISQTSMDSTDYDNMDLDSSFFQELDELTPSKAEDVVEQDLELASENITDDLTVEDPELKELLEEESPTEEFAELDEEVTEQNQEDFILDTEKNDLEDVAAEDFAEQEDPELVSLGEEFDLDGDEQDLFKELSESEESELVLEENAPLPPLDQKELDLRAIEELKVVHEKNIDEIIEKRKKALENRYTLSQVQALKIQLSDIAGSPKKLYLIPRKSKLIRLEDEKVYYTTKDIKVYAHTKLDYDRYRYLLDKKGNIKYRVDYKDTSNIELITQMYRTPHKFQRLEKKIEKSEYDSSFKYLLKLKGHTGFYKPDFSKKLINHNADLLPMFRTEAMLLSQMDFGLQLGLSGVYETVSGSTSTSGRFNYQSLSFGPVFKTSPLLYDFSLYSQVRLSVFSRASISEVSDTKVFNLNETSFMVGIEKEMKLKKLGYWSYGFNFQRKWINANATNESIDVSSRNNYDDSFGISIGHRSDWIF